MITTDDANKYFSYLWTPVSLHRFKSTSMKEQQTSKELIDKLRQLMNKKGITAFVLPSTDPHLSEYPTEHWQSRTFLSGFSGSAGTLVVTTNKAGLWTDSRYFLQAEEQLKGSGIKLYKEGLPQTVTIKDFLSAELQSGDSVGVDGKIFSIKAILQLEKELHNKGVRLTTDFDPIDELWTNRPQLPLHRIFLHQPTFSGLDCSEKIRQIRSLLGSENANALLLSALDEIAWTLNIRGCDVLYNPVAISFLLITETEVTLFIHPDKVGSPEKDYFKRHQVHLENYEHITSALHELNGYRILMDGERSNFSLYHALSSQSQIIDTPSLVTGLKAIRNQTEIDGIHRAMQRDGVALVKFLQWLERAVPEGKETELSISEQLRVFRSQGEHYIGESFATIAGYGAHGAIVHYSANAESNATLAPHGYLLLDSGAQYLDGTTDITRTIVLGELTEEEKRDYTLVLKGHIDLAMAKFPVGTRGAQLDVLARMPLWQNGMNFLHGTGHGVGHFLNVHEGPQSIRMNENPITLKPGMVTSNEPGIYKTGKHGVRIENLTLVQEAETTDCGDFLSFETITLCPIDTQAILPQLLGEVEVNWLNNYHHRVYDTLCPNLNEEEKEWLKEKTKEITFK